MTADVPVLEFRNASKHFALSRDRVVRALDGIDLVLEAGQTIGVVGESGCGKTTLSKLALMLQRPTGGEVLFRDMEVGAFGREDWRRFRTSVQAVFQDPWSSLNPRMRVIDIIAEPLVASSSMPRVEREARAARLMDDVGLPRAFLSRFPHELSGGQRQRVAIARALSIEPRLIVLDEPVSSLDVSIRSQVINLLKDLQEQRGYGYLLIGHDLATVAYISHRIAVMYLGRIVEINTSAELISDPKHPYTQGLLAAHLADHPAQRGRNVPLGGEVPSPLSPPPGCHFHTRCPKAMEICSRVEPMSISSGAGLVACHLYGQAG
ncbi:ATP-binding cassette domain-containing protein [Amaricoccus solimangrovi]|uniref:ATP-binding cassette domain-containing protein n=2 Tax=Amaricoccus solimangrovi TaxID=2589815 RepID=A0A501WDF7_9RHOB|nr:ATP-binding cassette domain-containing protein [Amaricoccus solimangrovi]